MEDLSFGSRLIHAWNAFTNRDPTKEFKSIEYSYSYRPDRPRFSRGNEKTIVTAVYNRIALDVAAINIKHCRMDSEGRYMSDIKSGLNDCLNIEANIDQTGRALIQDAVMSMMDEGCVAIIPIDTDLDPNNTSSYDILSMRTAQIIEWKPSMIKVKVYNDKTGLKEDVWVNKRNAAIIENPLYAVVNETNSTMQRLIRKLKILDYVDEQSGSGKLDLIIQLPYVIKSEARKKQAEERRKDIEEQLSGNKFGIAYTDGTERITQLNRPIENNLMKQIEVLTDMLYSQLGITQEILNGTADEKTMLNYYNRSIEPIVSAIVDEMKRKFLTKTARTQNQTIAAFRDPFKLVPVNDIAEIADKFTRNEIMTSNEIRQVIGMKPSMDPKADQLVNSNISQPVNDQNGMIDAPMDGEYVEDDLSDDEYGQAMEEVDAFDDELDELEKSLKHADDLMHYASEYYDPVKAHEYYMKNRKLKGTRAVRLNEEGKAVAKQVKESMMDQKKQRIEADKKTMDTSIESMRNQKESNVTSARDEVNSTIEGMRKQKEANIAGVRDATKAEVNSLREQKKKDIETHNSNMKKGIEQIQTLLKSASFKGLDPEAKAKKEAELLGKIEGLRAKNQEQREKLESDFSKSSESAQNSLKDKVSSFNESFSNSSKEARKGLKEKIKGYNEEFKNNSKTARTAHSETKKSLTDEYKQKYEAEEDKIRSEERYQYKPKGRGKGKGKSGNKLSKYLVGGNTSVPSKK